MDLFEKANSESQRLSTLWLGFSAAALAFGIHELGTWGASAAAAIGAAALASWGMSFLAGLTWAHQHQHAIKLNGAINSLARDHARRPEVIGKFEQANDIAGGAYLWQLRLLVAGALIFAIGQGVRVLASRDRANDDRCLALQRDMLSAHPRKKNGRDLFGAFGCRPQGEGSVMVPATHAEYLKARSQSGLPHAAAPSPASLPHRLSAPDRQ